MADPTQLKAKYQPVLNFIEQQPGAQVTDAQVQNGKLLIRATVPSEEVKNRVWDQIKLVDPTYSDLTHEITVQASDQGTAQRKPPQSYTVKSGDTLSKISKAVYGDANQYNRIFEANRDTLNDPNKIFPGQVLKIPA